MEVINLSKKRFESLEPYELPANIFNTEAKMYTLPIKNRWQTVNKLLKRLYITNGPIFGNKLQTINSLIDSRNIIDIPEIVFPEKLAVVDNKVVGYIMELVDSINLETALNSFDVSSERKIKYLHQIGELLEKMKHVRTYAPVDIYTNATVQDFYLNDMHENNFIIDRQTDSVRVVDIDSCKINGNYTFGSKYLTDKALIGSIRKYKREENDICGGFFEPSEDTEIYCYIMVILNTLYGGDVHKLSIPEFYDYLEYLYTIGVDLKLLTIFENILSAHHNENPYEYLDSLKNVFGRAHKNVFKRVYRK